MKMSQDEINKIAFKASQLGAKGYMVVGVILPQTATESEVQFVIQKPTNTCATSRAWYE